MNRKKKMTLPYRPGENRAEQLLSWQIARSLCTITKFCGNIVSAFACSLFAKKKKYACFTTGRARFSC
ncbi:hypothetical protein PUN28_007445 [Cardiocondyla obscurior]|uniref:Uncharacterized protein n=1 Tax=Cardiocondyla obscurior TaxID=286306 RepID=A0AAW2G3X8_9HYME